MAKFLCDDGSTVSFDNYKRKLGLEGGGPKFSPILETEVFFISAIKDISFNLKNSDTLDKTCVMQMIKGEKIDCPFEGNCNKCISNWYMTSPR